MMFKLERNKILMQQLINGINFKSQTLAFETYELQVHFYESF